MRRKRGLFPFKEKQDGLEKKVRTLEGRERILEMFSEKLLSRLNEAADRLRLSEDRFKELVDDVERICECSAALPVKTVKVSEDMLDAAKHGPMRVDVYRDNLRYTPVHVHRLVFSLTNNPGFRKAVHLRYSDGKQAVYMISDCALAATGNREFLKKFIEEVGEEMLNYARRNL
jgi:hypothetical protein